MRLITFTESDRARVGILSADGVIDLSIACPSLPTEMLALIEAGADAVALATSVCEQPPHFPLNAITFQPVIKRPPKVIAIGLNYRAHAEESNMAIPEVPLVFTKQSTSVTGAYDPIYWSKDSQALDYEGELALVIGRNCRRVRRDEARDVILGFCVANDVSVRDWQMRGTPPSFTMGKSWDSHCPIGPSIVIDDTIDPHQLRLRTWVNGALRQDSSTDDLIFDCYQLIEFLSTAFTLEAGDVILTGTPSGVGFAQRPPARLVPGDRVKVEIEGLGHIENPVITEPIWAARF
ncbi:MAG: fumarylacetoacetate hydrolase family protein [Proteobacteria bacterium]|nr:fumarylacetoacetate hydrolase family protein [Pseudomonadota bacterium]MDA0959051.1 fumarylacetoacetate hydrolase family protein [Pseudomonadota bacterium]